MAYLDTSKPAVSRLHNAGDCQLETYSHVHLVYSPNKLTVDLIRSGHIAPVKAPSVPEFFKLVLQSVRSPGLDVPQSIVSYSRKFLRCALRVSGRDSREASAAIPRDAFCARAFLGHFSADCTLECGRLNDEEVEEEAGGNLG